MPCLNSNPNSVTLGVSARVSVVAVTKRGPKTHHKHRSRLNISLCSRAPAGSGTCNAGKITLPPLAAASPTAPPTTVQIAPGAVWAVCDAADQPVWRCAVQPTPAPPPATHLTVHFSRFARANNLSLTFILRCATRLPLCASSRSDPTNPRPSRMTRNPNGDGANTTPTPKTTSRKGGGEAPYRLHAVSILRPTSKLYCGVCLSCANLAHACVVFTAVVIAHNPTVRHTNVFLA